jgi:hypothetical protein
MELHVQRRTDKLMLYIVDINSGCRKWNHVGGRCSHFIAHHGCEFDHIDIEDFWLCEICWLLDCVLVSIHIVLLEECDCICLGDNLSYNILESGFSQIPGDVGRWLSLQSRKQTVAVSMDCVVLVIGGTSKAV